MASHSPSTNIIGIGAQNCTLNDCNITGVSFIADKVDVKEIQDQTLANVDLWTKDTVEPAALAHVLEKIRTGSACVTITGSPGEGKTTVGYWVLKKLKDTRYVYEVRCPKQFVEVIKKSSEPVIMLDDIFGQTLFQEAAWQEWKPFIEQFINMKEQKPKKETGNLILIAREFVLNTGSRDTEDPWEMLVNKRNVNISKDFTGNKEKILYAIASKFDKHLDSNTIETICSINIPHGFPHTCKLFMTLYGEDSRMSVVGFFSNPLEFLKKSLKILLFKDKVIEHIFTEMIRGNGYVVKSELSKCGYEYIAKANDLSTYIKPGRGGYSFDHPSILDTVAFLFCETKLSFVLDHCGIRFIVERIWQETPDGKKREETDEGARLMAEIPWKEAAELGRRFVREIVENKSVGITLSCHNAWKSDMFIQLLIKNMTNEQLSVLDILLDHLCIYNRADCVTVCVQRGADVDRRGSLGSTHLHKAVGSTKTELVHALLQSGANVNIRDVFSRTPLHCAAMMGRTESIRLLVENGANVNVTDIDGLTPSHLALARLKSEAILVLWECGASVNKLDLLRWTPLHEAARDGRTNSIRMLVWCGTKVNVRNMLHQTPLHYAAYYGTQESVCALVGCGANVNVTDKVDWTPLHYAAMHGHTGSCLALLKCGAKANITDKEGLTPLHRAAMHGHTGSCLALLKCGAKANITDMEGRIPLDHAVMGGHIETADGLKFGDNVNSTDNAGRTLLHHAAMAGRTESIPVLVEFGANVSITDNVGLTPLHYAAIFGHTGTGLALLKCGAKVNITDMKGLTPLHRAAMMARTELVCVLVVLCGAKVNSKSLVGLTPLHCAALAGRTDSVRLLLKCGAKVNITDKDGRTPLDWATNKGHGGASSVLLAAGGRYTPCTIS